MKDYVINSDTLAIIPCENNMSLVYEGDRIIIVNSKPNNIIKMNCLRNGSTLLGRQKGTENMTGDVYKVPIVVRESDSLIFFPTSSPRLKSVSWINLNNIDRTYYDKINCLSVIIFINSVKVEFNVSLNIINNQIFRATRLEHNLWRNKLPNA